MIGHSPPQPIDQVGRDRPARHSLDRERLGLLANLGLFTVFAAFAFARDPRGLFDDYDGRYLLVEILNRLRSTEPSLAFGNDFLQSIGNIQFTNNPWVLFVFWPVGWMADFVAAKVVTYLVIAVFMFLASYWLARLLSLGSAVALAAGWIFSIAVTPVVPYPFFCPILALAPTGFLLFGAPVVAFWLMRMAGRTSLAADALAAAGLLLLVVYFLAATPSAFPLAAVGCLPYAVIALALVRRRAELVRKFAVLLAICVAAVGLLLPWYLMGLFAYMSPQVFADDFTVAYQGAAQVSILFQGRQVGWAGPALVVVAGIGALLSVRDPSQDLRIAARVLLAVIVLLVGVRLSFLVAGDWLIFPTFYLEAAVWPLYAVFCAVCLHRAIAFVIANKAIGRSLRGAGLRAVWVTPAVALVAALALGAGKSTRDYAPFPPRVTPMVDILRSEIAFGPGARFNGRVATIIPVDPGSPSHPWEQQLHASLEVWRAIGNDQMATGLWYYQIPTLFEYNQFLSPAFHALAKRTLQRPVLKHVRNVQIFTHADPRILSLLGVRYVILPDENSDVGVRRAVQEVAGRRWGLFELPAPNLATYSPTTVEVRQSLSSTLELVTNPTVDLTRVAVVREKIDGPLVPVEVSSISNVEGDLHVVARSPGRSLLVVPLEFSHCVELRDRQPAGRPGGARLVRVDGLLAGVLFEREVDAVLAFRFGPLTNPTCRWKDHRELQSMLGRSG